jgi:hypothetical protein
MSAISLLALVLWYAPCPMAGILDALVAFVREHQRCGELDGDRDGGYVWLVCSCGGQIVQPAIAPPRSGEGPFAVVAGCGGYVKISRHADRTAAERTIERLRSGCGSGCWPSSHQLIQTG